MENINILMTRIDERFITWARTIMAYIYQQILF